MQLKAFDDDEESFLFWSLLVFQVCKKTKKRNRTSQILNLVNACSERLIIGVFQIRHISSEGTSESISDVFMRTRPRQTKGDECRNP